MNALYSESIPNFMQTYQSFKDAVLCELKKKGRARAIPLPSRTCCLSFPGLCALMAPLCLSLSPPSHE